MPELLQALEASERVGGEGCDGPEAGSFQQLGGLGPVGAVGVAAHGGVTSLGKSRLMVLPWYGSIVCPASSACTSRVVRSLVWLHAPSPPNLASLGSQHSL